MGPRAVLHKTAISLLAACLVVDLAATASDPAATWSHRWDANVWNTYCELKLDYYLPYRNDPQRRGFLANRSFDRLFAQFTASTRTHFGLVPEEELFKIRFGLLFYGENGRDPEPEDRIMAASIETFRLSPREKQSVHGILAFGLAERESLLLLEQFKLNKTIEVNIVFADGEERSTKIYPSGDKDFFVWAEMFKTCIRENVRPS